MNTRTHGTLTAEQVMTIAGKHQPDYCSDTHVCFDWQAIADELNATMGNPINEATGKPFDFSKLANRLNGDKGATLGSGTLTPEQVRDLIERHSAWVIGNNRRFHNGAYEEIADELNAELGSGTCKPTESERWVVKDNG